MKIVAASSLKRQIGVLPVIGPNTRWVVDCFLAELEHLKLKQPPAPWTAQRRIALASMVLVEVELDDPECWALHWLAAAVIDLCRWPNDPVVIGRYLEARGGYRDVLQAAYDAG